MPKRRNPQRLFPAEEYPSPLLTEEMVAEVEEELKPPARISPTVLRPTLVQEIKNARYKNLTIDLATIGALPEEQRTRQPLGLRAQGIVADTMTIIRVDSPFEYMINDPTADPNPLTAADRGWSETEFEIEEIYITVPAGAVGTAIIRVNWNPYLIRIG